MKVPFRVDRKARIEMLPLIDIVFLLLVFFIYAMLSMAVHHGVPVDLPISKTAVIDKKLIMAISVKENGTIFLDEEPVQLNLLVPRLKAKTAGMSAPGVLLFADKSVTYQRLFDVIDQIKTAGISRISLEAEKER